MHQAWNAIIRSTLNAIVRSTLLKFQSMRIWDNMEK